MNKASDSVLDNMAGRELPEPIATLRDRLRGQCRRVMVEWLTDEDGEPFSPPAFALLIVVATDSADDFACSAMLSLAFVEDSAVEASKRLLEWVRVLAEGEKRVARYVRLTGLDVRTEER